MLANCRVKCRKMFQNEKYLPESITAAGGLEDMFVDAFGFLVPVCSKSAGFDISTIKDLIGNHIAIDERQSYFPKFTQKGFEKVRMPENVFNFLKQYISDNPHGWESEGDSSNFVIPKYNMMVENKINLTRTTLSIERTLLNPLDKQSENFVHKVLLRAAEAWSGIKLEYLRILGVRSYANNSVVLPHIDA